MPERTFASLHDCWLAAGYTEDAFQALLPDWWSAECEADENLVADIEFVVARALGVSIEKIRGRQPLPVGRTYDVAGYWDGYPKSSDSRTCWVVTYKGNDTLIATETLQPFVLANSFRNAERLFERIVSNLETEEPTCIGEIEPIDATEMAVAGFALEWH